MERSRADSRDMMEDMEKNDPLLVARLTQMGEQE